MTHPTPDPLDLIRRCRSLADSAERSHSAYDFQTLRLCLNDLADQVLDLQAAAGRAETVEADMVDWALATRY